MGTTYSHENKVVSRKLASRNSVECTQCKASAKQSTAVSFCTVCRDFYCQSCVDYHLKVKTTQSHPFLKLIDFTKTCRDFPCEICSESNNKAKYLCVECRQLYCIKCTQRHRDLNATQNHPILLLKRNILLKTELHASREVSFAGAQGPSASTSKQKPEMIHTRKTPWSAASHGDFSVRTPSDNKDCSLHRMISMPDGRIVVLDTHNGFKIKLFSENFKLLDEIQCNFCRAVTCVDDKTIKVVAADEIITYSVLRNEIKEKQRNKEPCGRMFDMAYRNDDVILRYETGAIDCVAHGENVIKEDRVLIMTDFIHYDSNSDRLLVVNSTLGHNTITCHDLTTKTNWELAVKGGTRGIIVAHGYILVAMLEDHTVKQLDLNGILLPDPLLTSKDGIENPTALAYQKEQGRLLVGSAFSDTVKVYNLTS